MRANQAELLGRINQTGDYNDEVEVGLRQALDDFKANHTW
jgi:F-type H+-transporting ATPase subunit alpha